MAVPESHDTLVRLLHAARTLFATRGYRGASIRAITAAAGANLGAVTYHFGSKRELYEAVLEQCFRPLREAVSEVSAQAQTPNDRIEALLRVFFRHLRSNPDIPQFLLQEVAAGETPSAPVRYTLEHVLGTLAALVQEGQSEGSLLEADPRLAAVSIIAQPVHLTLLTQLLGRTTSDASPLLVDPDRLEQHAVDFVSRALLRTPAEASLK